MKPAINLTSLAKGLANKEMVFYFQPIISLFNGKICGAESLIRWILPDGTVIMPGSFIPMAEESGLITEITREMLPKAVQALNLLTRIDESLFVTFNVSTKDLQGHDFSLFAHSVLFKDNEKPKNLVFEITENAFLPNDNAILRTMQEIADQGLHIYLDDFSAGQTTLSHLTQLPVTAIKIAMPITQRAPLSRMDFRLFRHLISLGHQLNLDIIAEGVEDLETHTLVASSGCTHSQGYFFGRPMPLQELVKLIHQEPAWTDYPFGLEYLAQIDHIDFRRDVIRAALMIFSNNDDSIKKRAMERLPELNSQNCLFGRWYSQVKKFNQTTPEFRQLGIEHENLHEHANNLIELALSHTSLMQLEHVIEMFSAQSKLVLNLVQDLEIERLKENFVNKIPVIK